MVLEKAPKELRGGNGYFTAGLYRIVHNGKHEREPVVERTRRKETGK